MSLHDVLSAGGYHKHEVEGAVLQPVRKALVRPTAAAGAATFV